jgi:predicted LPLAT superfamily acyltransferase
MPSWQGKSKGTTLGYSIFVAILKKGGVFPAYLLLRFVSLYYFFFSYKSSSPVFHFFHKRLGYNIIVSLGKLYRNYYLFGQSLIDRVVIMSGIPNKFTFNFDGEENLHKIVALQRGGLLLSAHIGNWEIAGHLLKRLGTRINIVMFDGEHRQIKKYLDSVTGEKNVHIIVIRNDLSHIYEINDAFKNNELVCMHADRFLEGNKTLQAGLLGEKAKFPMGPFVLAAQFKVPVSFVFAMKETNLHYHFFSSPPKEYAGSNKESIMQDMLNDFANEMGQKVKQYPEQWYNYYNFWRQ